MDCVLGCVKNWQETSYTETARDDNDGHIEGKIRNTQENLPNRVGNI